MRATPEKAATRVDTVVVAVPAHDEEAEIGGCLTDVVSAGRAAIASGEVRRVVVSVATHRCSDRTESRARAVLPQAGDVSGYVISDQVSGSVGEVRRRLLAATAARVPLSADSWVFNTDADSRVPVDWIALTLRQALLAKADAVAGLVSLTDWQAPSAARRAYDGLLRAGHHSGGHHHVYGANLAVRWGAYLDVDGFPTSDSEDHGLVRRLRSSGHQVLSSTQPVVATSAREPGRAAQGLAALLTSLRTAPTSEA